MIRYPAEPRMTSAREQVVRALMFLRVSDVDDIAFHTSLSVGAVRQVLRRSVGTEIFERRTGKYALGPVGRRWSLIWAEDA